MRNVFWIPAVTFFAAGLASAAAPVDDDVKLNEERSTLPCETTEARPDLRGVEPGERLFWMTFDDHVRIVTSIPDVTGDGIAEVVVGLDDSQGLPLRCLDGTSSGEATVVWSRRFFDGASGGNPYSSESIIPITDTEGNTWPNMLIGTAWGGRSAYNLDGLAGDILWKFDTYNEPDSGWVYSIAEIDDMNGDGIAEVAFGVGSPNDGVYLVDGADAAGGYATLLWRYTASDATMSVHTVGDVNADTYNDVVIGIGDYGDAVACLDGNSPSATGTVLWNYPTGGPSVWDMAVQADMNGDGIDEVLVALWATDGSSARCLDGASGAELWRSTTITDYSLMVEPLEDFTGDGAAEVIVSSYMNATVVLNGSTGAEEWRTWLGTLNGGASYVGRAIDDIDGDGTKDVIVGSFDEYAYAMNGKDGEVLWAYNTGHRVYSVAPVEDVDGDGIDDVVVGNQNLTYSDQQVLHVLSGGGDTIFADGFENGNTSAWSETVP